MQSIKFLRILAVPLAALALVIGACAAPSTGDGTAAPKQEITVIQTGDADTLDPDATAVRPSLNMTGTFAEALTKVVYNDKNEPQLVPSLASSWKQLNDTTWQFKLRQGVKFSNGEPFDASVVKFSFDRMASDGYKSAAKKYVTSVKSVDVVDAETVNVVTKSAYPLAALDYNAVFMVPPKYTKEVGDQAFALKPVGTGPFKFVEWVKDDHVTVEANPDYWGGRPKLDKVVFKPVPESSTRSAAIQTGQADVVLSLSIADIATLKQKPGIVVDVAPSLRLTEIRLDQATDPIMKNVKVRQALNYAVDKEAIVKGIYQGNAKVLQGQGLSPEYFGFNPNLKAYPYDPAKAKQLLAEAGYPNGFDMTIYTPRGAYVGDFETVQAVADQLGKVGVKVTVKVMEFAVYLADWAAHKLTPAIFAAIATNGDADTMFDHYRFGAQRAMANLPEMNALIAQERATLDPVKRLELLKQGAQIQNEQALAIWLVQLSSISAVRDRVQNFRLEPTEAFDLSKVFVK